VEEVVYRITEAAGIVWVSPSIWMKERPTVNAAQARELLAQGRKDGTYEAPIPDDDKKALSEATDLLDMAQTAWEQHVRGPEVEILLKMAANFEEGGNQENGSPPPEPKQEQDTKEEKPKRDEPKPDAERPRRQRPTPKEPEPEPEPQSPRRTISRRSSPGTATTGRRCPTSSPASMRGPTRTARKSSST
jgi:outer membrane biosynthesis protein TonB